MHHTIFSSHKRFYLFFFIRTGGTKMKASYNWAKSQLFFGTSAFKSYGYFEECFYLKNFIFNPLIYCQNQALLNPIWHGGMTPQNVFDHCAQTLRRRKLKLVTFNINLFSIKKVIFGSLGYPVLPWQRVCHVVLEIFWSYRSICFLITKF